MALQEFLLFLNIVIDDTCVRGSIKNFGAIFIGQEVDALIDVFVETHDPLQILKRLGELSYQCIVILIFIDFVVVVLLLFVVSLTVIAAHLLLLIHF